MLELPRSQSHDEGQPISSKTTAKQPPTKSRLAKSWKLGRTVDGTESQDQTEVNLRGGPSGPPQGTWLLVDVGGSCKVCVCIEVRVHTSTCVLRGIASTWTHSEVGTVLAMSLAVSGAHSFLFPDFVMHRTFVTYYTITFCGYILSPAALDQTHLREALDKDYNTILKFFQGVNYQGVKDVLATFEPEASDKTAIVLLLLMSYFKEPKDSIVLDVDSALKSECGGL
ncbi:hypothetical protein C0J45_15985 [Silurus meridionalis]|nr:hypothetical protein C0J45_15985 [Silurus meridionalis]